MMTQNDANFIETGRHLFAQSCSFEIGVANLDDLPPSEYPELGFVGRSNVGKSSLLNALTGQKSLARISNTPGRTQQLNFFLLAQKAWLVDMPGYGYARESRSKSRAWNRLLRNYIQSRPTLSRVFVLVDCRHGIKTSDVDMFTLCEKNAISYQLILTKHDKCTQSQIDKSQETCTKLLTKRVAAHPQIITTSAVKGTGIDVLRASLAELITPSWDANQNQT